MDFENAKVALIIHYQLNPAHEVVTQNPPPAPPRKGVCSQVKCNVHQPTDSGVICSLIHHLLVDKPLYRMMPGQGLLLKHNLHKKNYCPIQYGNRYSQFFLIYAFNCGLAAVSAFLVQGAPET